MSETKNKKRFFGERSVEHSEVSSNKIIPLKDHVIHHNDVHIVLKKDEPCEVPKMFHQGLKTEGVIK